MPFYQSHMGCVKLFYPLEHSAFEIVQFQKRRAALILAKKRAFPPHYGSGGCFRNRLGTYTILLFNRSNAHGSGVT